MNLEVFVFVFVFSFLFFSWSVSDHSAQFVSLVLFFRLPGSACHSVSWKQTLTLYITIGCNIFLTLTFGLIWLLLVIVSLVFLNLVKRNHSHMLALMLRLHIVLRDGFIEGSGALKMLVLLSVSLSLHGVNVPWPTMENHPFI